MARTYWNQMSGGLTGAGGQMVKSTVQGTAQLSTQFRKSMADLTKAHNDSLRQTAKVTSTSFKMMYSDAQHDIYAMQRQFDMLRQRIEKVRFAYQKWKSDRSFDPTLDPNTGKPVNTPGKKKEDKDAENSTKEFKKMIKDSIMNLVKSISVLAAVKKIAGGAFDRDEATQRDLVEGGGNRQAWKQWQGTLADITLDTKLSEEQLINLTHAFKDAGMPVQEATRNLASYAKVASTGIKVFGMSEESAAGWIQSLRGQGKTLGEISAKWDDMYSDMIAFNATIGDVTASVDEGTAAWSQYGGTIGRSLDQMQKGILQTRGLFRSLNVDTKLASKFNNQVLNDTSTRLRQASYVSAMTGMSGAKAYRMFSDDQAGGASARIKAGMKMLAGMMGGYSGALADGGAKLGDQDFMNADMARAYGMDTLDATGFDKETMNQVLGQFQARMKAQGGMRGSIFDEIDKFVPDMKATAGGAGGTGATAASAMQALNNTLPGLIGSINATINAGIGKLITAIQKPPTGMGDITGKKDSNIFERGLRGIPAAYDGVLNFGNQAIKSAGGNFKIPLKTSAESAAFHKKWIGQLHDAPINAFQGGAQHINTQASNLVAAAEKTATAMNTTGKCAAGVQTALAKAGMKQFLGIGDAWDMGKKMSKSPLFEKIPMDQAQKGDILFRSWNKDVQKAHGGKNWGDTVIVTGKNKDGSLTGANDHKLTIPADGGRYINSYALRLKQSPHGTGPLAGSLTAPPNRGGSLITIGPDGKPTYSGAPPTLPDLRTVRPGPGAGLVNAHDMKVYEELTKQTTIQKEALKQQKSDSEVKKVAMDVMKRKEISSDGASESHADYMGRAVC